MVRKRKKAEDTQKPFCYYCDRVFNDESTLIQHQRAKHFKCPFCSKKLTTAQGLAVHCIQVHKKNLHEVPSAKPGKGDPSLEIFGMSGVPEGAVPGVAPTEEETNEDNADFKVVINDPEPTLGVASATVAPVIVPAPVTYSSPAPQLAYPQPNPYLPGPYPAYGYAPAPYGMAQPGHYPGMPTHPGMSGPMPLGYPPVIPPGAPPPGYVPPGGQPFPMAGMPPGVRPPLFPIVPQGPGAASVPPSSGAPPLFPIRPSQQALPHLQAPGEGHPDGQLFPPGEGPPPGVAMAPPQGFAEGQGHPGPSGLETAAQAPHIGGGPPGHLQQFPPGGLGHGQIAQAAPLINGQVPQLAPGNPLASVQGQEQGMGRHPGPQHQGLPQAQPNSILPGGPIQLPPPGGVRQFEQGVSHGHEHAIPSSQGFPQQFPPGQGGPGAPQHFSGGGGSGPGGPNQFPVSQHNQPGAGQFAPGGERGPVLQYPHMLNRGQAPANQTFSGPGHSGPPQPQPISHGGQPGMGGQGPPQLFPIAQGGPGGGPGPQRPTPLFPIAQGGGAPGAPQQYQQGPGGYPAPLASVPDGELVWKEHEISPEESRAMSPKYRNYVMRKPNMGQVPDRPAHSQQVNQQGPDTEGVPMQVGYEHNYN